MASTGEDVVQMTRRKGRHRGALWLCILNSEAQTNRELACRASIWKELYDEPKRAIEIANSEEPTAFLGV
jgi:hypothetical protein